MSIDYWIWGNVNSQIPQIQEFDTRLCSIGFNPVKGELELISKRLISTMWRNGDRTVAQCWFAGFLKPDLYVIALGAEQNTLLGTQFAGTRGLLCTMAMGFTGSDIISYRQDSRLFDPLKDILYTINVKCTGDEETPPISSISELQKHILIPSEESLRKHCEIFCAEDNICAQIPELNIYNMFSSEPFLNSALWVHSRTRPVALGLLTEDDGEQLLGMFPNGAVTVLGGTNRKYSGGVKKSAIQIRMEKEQEAIAERKRKEEAARKVNKQTVTKSKTPTTEENTIVAKTSATISAMNSAKAAENEINEAIALFQKAKSQNAKQSGAIRLDSLLQPFSAERKWLQEYCKAYAIKFGWPRNKNEQFALLENAIKYLGR